MTRINPVSSIYPTNTSYKDDNRKKKEKREEKKKKNNFKDTFERSTVIYK